MLLFYEPIVCSVVNRLLQILIVFDFCQIFVLFFFVFGVGLFIFTSKSLQIFVFIVSPIDLVL